MRRILTVLPFLVLTTAASAAGWLAFSDPAGQFTVDLPGTPTVGHDSVTNSDNTQVDMLEYTIDRGDNALVVIISDLTRYPNADASKVIDGAVGGAKGSAVTTLSDTIASVDGQVGREVLLIDKDGNHIDDRIFFVGGKLYQVMYVLPSAPTPAETADARRYAASFHFTQ
jgi:hypothetical protein